MGALFGIIINFLIYYFIFKLVIKSLPKRTPEPIIVKSPKKWKKKEEEFIDPFIAPLVKTEISLPSEKMEEIYYNETESAYSFSRNRLKEAIVYAEIIGQPVSRKRFGLNRR